MKLVSKEELSKTPQVAVSLSGTLEREHLSLAKVTLLGLAGLQLAPSISVIGAILIIYSGNGAWLSLLIALTSALCLSAAVNVFARRYVVTGSLMSYVGFALGNRARRLTAASYLVGYVVAVAAGIAAIVVFTSSFLVSVGFDFGAGGVVQSATAVVVAFAAGGLAYRGLDTSIRVTAFLFLLCLPFVAVVIVAAAWKGGISLVPQFRLQDTTPAGVIGGAVVAMSAFVGFDGLATLAAETKEPKRTVPRLILLVLGIVGVVYIVAALVQVGPLSAELDQITAGVSPTAVMAAIGGVSFLQKPTDLLLAGATFAGLVALMNYGSRIIATAAADGLLPRRAARIHPRFHSPTGATIILTVAATAVLVLLQVVASASPLESSTYLYILFSYYWVLPYVLIAIGAIVILVREGRRNVLVPGVIVVGAATFVVLFVYGIANSSGGVLGALPYVAIGTTVLLFGVLSFADRGRASDELPGDVDGDRRSELSLADD
ncbi:APC family permease [Rhodococcus sp. NPDC059968]|uniref:APC family permease n=1 Tax=Rhodococcus sp. NPDC059968 TaxID=3347017 RepID=UPI00366DF66E